MSPSEKIIAQNILIKNFLDRMTISMKSSLNNYQKKVKLNLTPSI